MGDAVPASSGYHEAPPRSALACAVRCIWRYQSDAAERREEPIPADGCPELIVNLGGSYFEVTPGAQETRQPPALFAGQLTRPLTLVSHGPVATLGVRFEPDGARGFFGRPMHEATNRRIALPEFLGKDAVTVIETLSPLGWAERFSVIETFVAGVLAASKLPPDQTVRSSVVALLCGEDLPRIDGDRSPRQFQRRFRDRVGVSARDLAAVLRFRRVFDEIERQATPSWAASALAAGYFDQPHMARDFRRFLRCTASDWARRKAGLASALARARPVSELTSQRCEPET